MVIIITVLLAAAVLTVLAIAMAWILGWANFTFHVEVDEKVSRICGVLPGANCGGCGYVGCVDYAEALVAGGVEANLCGPGAAACVSQIAEILGVDAVQSFPYRAVIHCAAGYADRLGRTEYRGERTCVAANLIAGVQGCTYGCLGMGDCSRACKYGAIEIVDGLARIDYDACIGCKVCAAVCPRSIISMVPFKQERMLVVQCSNLDRGPEVKKVCNLGCIGCTACTKQAEVVEMDGFLPVIDYTAYESVEELDAALGKCPRATLAYVGMPTEEDIEAVKDEELPETVRADFKTTVDDTEWRG